MANDDSRNWSGLTLAEGLKLSQPMVPDSDPSILPWETVSYRLQYGKGDNYVVAHATMVSSLGDAQVWRAFCAGPGDTTMEEADFPTAEAARAAVEDHYFKEVES